MKRIALLCIAATLIFACNNSTDSNSVQSPEQSDASGGQAESEETRQADLGPGCKGKIPETDGDFTTFAFRFNGKKRAVDVVVPPEYDAQEPRPVVFTFHGAGSNKEQQLAYSGFLDYTKRDNVLLVAPNAAPAEVMAWEPFVGAGKPSDLDFFAKLLKQIEKRFCVDQEQIFATGMSSGGYMSSAVLCEFSDRLAAVAAVTATVYAENWCDRAQPTPYLYFHGTKDPVVPFEGMKGFPGAWAEQNKCQSKPAEQEIGSDVTHQVWSGCEAATEFYIIDGGGHTWPGSPIVLPEADFGTTSPTIDASDLIWNYFFPDK